MKHRALQASRVRFDCAQRCRTLRGNCLKSSQPVHRLQCFPSTRWGTEWRAGTEDHWLAHADAANAWHFEEHPVSLRMPAKDRWPPRSRASAISQSALEKLKKQQIRPARLSRLAGVYHFKRSAPASERSARGTVSKTDSRFWWMSYTWKGERISSQLNAGARPSQKRYLPNAKVRLRCSFSEWGSKGNRCLSRNWCQEFERHTFLPLLRTLRPRSSIS